MSSFLGSSKHPRAHMQVNGGVESFPDNVALLRHLSASEDDPAVGLQQHPASSGQTSRLRPAAAAASPRATLPTPSTPSSAAMPPVWSSSTRGAWRCREAAGAVWDTTRPRNQWKLRRARIRTRSRRTCRCSALTCGSTRITCSAPGLHEGCVERGELEQRRAAACCRQEGLKCMLYCVM